MALQVEQQSEGEAKLRTLLLVDDEENILSSLRRLLRKDGYRILCARSGQEGLEILQVEPDVDLIMSDQRMPQMTGTAFLRQAKILSPNSVRIVLSGYTDLESVTAAINEGAVYKFLTKPWDDEILRLSIKEALHYKWTMDENHMLQNMMVEINQEFAASIEKLTLQLTQLKNERDLMLSVVAYCPVPIIVVTDTRIVRAASQVARDIIPILSSEATLDVDTVLSPSNATDADLSTKKWVSIAQSRYEKTEFSFSVEGENFKLITLKEDPHEKH